MNIPERFRHDYRAYRRRVLFVLKVRCFWL